MQFVDTDVFYNYSLSLLLKGMAANIKPPFFVAKKRVPLLSYLRYSVAFVAQNSCFLWCANVSLTFIILSVSCCLCILRVILLRIK